MKQKNKNIYTILAVVSLLTISAFTLVTARTEPQDIDKNTPLFQIRTSNANEQNENIQTNYPNKNTENTDLEATEEPSDPVASTSWGSPTCEGGPNTTCGTTHCGYTCTTCGGWGC